ncbi:hypothetical protein GCM10009733_040610 [Nonomuraea maheshkhaliensis]|uniref:NACHT domain-containing protein n=1 Tax=Nonomuraea maheshkhaliensis TaxID=419590 RepID=A0ABP4R717_9ACTN
MIVSAALGLVALPVLINVATSDDAPVWAVPAVLVLGVAATWLTLRQYLADHGTRAGGRFPPGFRQRMLGRARSTLDARLVHRPAGRVGISLEEAVERVRPPDALSVAAEQVPAPQGVWTAWEDASRSLLLLGAPGAGKTTQLLDLADHLLTAAEADETQPVPVVVDLVSFSPVSARRVWRRQAADGDQDAGTRWLLKILAEEYRLGHRVAVEYLAAHRVVLLLDGLDEVPPARRRDCLRWINHLQDRFTVPPMVVCGRDLDYAEIGELLALQRAVRIVPLHREKVIAWLEEGGPEAEHVRQAVTRDPTLWDLLDAPLWLAVVAAVAESARDEGAGGSVSARRGALLDAFVDEAIQRGDQAGYTRADVVRWLGRLAAPGRPVVASRWGPGVISVGDEVPAEVSRAVSSRFAVPLMALVTLAGAAVLLRHAGVVVALAAAAGLLIMVLAQWLIGRRRSEESGQVRPARLGATVAVLGTILSALALTVTETVSTLVGLLPEPPKSVNWPALLAVFGGSVVVVGLILAVVATVADRRSGRRSEPLPWVLFRRAGESIVITAIFLGGAVYFLGMGYLVLSAIPAPYVFSGACALGFFAVVGSVCFGIAFLLDGEGHRVNESEDEVGWVPFAGLGVALLAVFLIGADTHHWLPSELVFHLMSVGVGACAGVYVAFQTGRVDHLLSPLVTLCLVAVGHLPWRLHRFLRYCARHDLLRSEGRDYRFRHQLLAEHFVAATASPRPQGG